MKEKMVKVVYCGENSGISVPEIGLLNHPRGEPFEASKKWFDAQIKLEPGRWELAGAKSQGSGTKEETT